MEVTFVNPGVEYMLESIMEIQTDGQVNFWSEPLYRFYPQLARDYATSLPFRWGVPGKRNLSCTE